MKLATLVETGTPALLERHGHHLTADQRQALQAIRDCRSGALGSGLWQCQDCQHTWQQHRSCGHRACPQCQHHHASDWVSRQTAKLLPAPYFMITFTLPAGLRRTAYVHPKRVYNLLFEVAMQTLRRFAVNHPDLGAEPGACAVLHTHSRRLEYHPHVHIIVPGAVIDPRRNQWRKLRSRYLFNGNQLATVFRAKMLDALRQSQLPCPANLPPKWVVQCQHVGKGAGAIKYLSRYLYRGVIREQDILDFDAQTQQVRLRYREGKSNADKVRSLPLGDFLWQLMMQVLPKGFRRVRDYGLLHANAANRRLMLQLLLSVAVPAPSSSVRVKPTCPHCQTDLLLIAFVRRMRTLRPN